MGPVCDVTCCRNEQRRSRREPGSGVWAKPRTVWACQPVAAMIPASVALWRALVAATTSAFFLARSASGLPAGFLSPLSLGRLAYLGRHALRLGSCSRCVLGGDCVRVHPCSPGLGRGRHIDHSGSEKLQGKSLVIGPARSLSAAAVVAGWAPFLYTRQNDAFSIIKAFNRSCSVEARAHEGTMD
jgi:hypothetical protein